MVVPTRTEPLQRVGYDRLDGVPLREAKGLGLDGAGEVGLGGVAVVVAVAAAALVAKRLQDLTFSL